MAQTVIDQLIVTLGLDPSGFKKGQKDAAAELLKTKKEMTGMAVEMGAAFRRIGVEFAALFFGMSGAKDIVHKFAELNDTMAALGYTSRQLGESAYQLRLYQQIAGGFGGTAAGVNQMVTGLEQGMFNLRYMGQMSGQMAAWLRFAGGLPPTNAQGGIDVLKMVSMLRERLSGLSNVDKNQILTALGVSEGIRNAIFATRQQYDAWVRSQRESARQMADGKDSAQDLQRAWRNLQYSIDGAAATILTNLTPALKSMFVNLAKIAPTELENLGKWIKTHGPEVTAFFGELNTLISGSGSAMSVLARAGHYMFGLPGKWLGEGAGWISTRIHSAADWKKLLSPDVTSASNEYGLPSGLLSNVITRESGWNPYAVSDRGAVGIAQLLPQFHHGAGVNPVSDIMTAAQTLAAYYRRFGNWKAALIAYNEGPTAYAKGIRDPGAVRYANAILAHTPAAAMHHSTSVSIGSMTINTKATDAHGIAHDMHGEVTRKFNVFQTDNGVQ